MPPPPLSPSYVLLPLCLHEILIVFHVNQERKTNIFRIILSHNQTLKKKKKKIFLGNLFYEKYFSQKHNFRPNKLMISVVDVM